MGLKSASSHVQAYNTTMHLSMHYIILTSHMALSFLLSPDSLNFLHLPSLSVPDPVYVYDHRGLRVRKDSLPSSELEAPPTIVVDPQEEGS